MNRRDFIGASAGVIGFGTFAGARATVDRAEPDAGFRVRFIRHAESQIDELRTIDVPGAFLPPDSGVSYPLTRAGVEQAVALGERLRNEKLLAIYSSTRLRALQTADAIAFAQTSTIEPVPELVDVAFAAPDTSISAIDYRASVVAMTAWVAGHFDARAPGGESLTEVLDRVLPFVRRTIDQHAAAEGTVVFVSHGVLLSVALPYLFENVSPGWALTAMLPNTGIVSGEVAGGALICSDWAGTSPR